MPYTLLPSWTATCSMCIFSRRECFWNIVKKLHSGASTLKRTCLRTRDGISYNCAVRLLYTFLILPPTSRQKTINPQAHQHWLVDVQLSLAPGPAPRHFKFPISWSNWLIEKLTLQHKLRCGSPGSLIPSWKWSHHLPTRSRRVGAKISHRTPNLLKKITDLLKFSGA